jgi:uncharacterized protein (DUF885 family)
MTSTRHSQTQASRRSVLRALAATSLVPPVPVALAATATDDAARLRALIERSDAAADRLEALPRNARDRATSGAVFVDPLAPSTLAAQLANAERDWAALQLIRADRLPAVERIAYDVFAYRIRREIDRHRSGVARIQRLAPLDSSFGLHLEFPDYVSGAGAPFNDATDFEIGLERLSGFSGYLGSLQASLQEGLAAGYRQPEVVVRKVIAQAEALLAQPRDDNPLLAALKRWPASFDAATRARFERAYQARVEREALPAYARLRDYLQRDYLPQALAAPGRVAMRDGALVYAAELAHHTTLPADAARTHATGLAEVERIREQMETVRRDLRFAGSLPEFFEFIRTDPQFYFTQPADLIERMHQIEARIWSGMPTLFERRPRAPFAVRALPAIGGQRGTGYYKPGPPDGVTPGVLWFNMAMLNTRPIPTLETLTLHEGIPGHHYQITLALEDPRLPPILRFGGLTAYSEGWGLYAESLGPELGMFTDPYQWFGHLDMEMLRAVRLVVDTGLHAQGWPRQRAIDYMLANTSMAARDVEVEIDRYIALPGQACAYKTGELELQALRQHATSTLGAKFDVRAFHAEVLDTGALPLAVLRSKIERWVAAAA